MAKNTGNTQFRHLDVSPYSDEEPDDVEQGQDDTQGPSEGEVQSLLSSGRNVDALKVILTNPPIDTKNQAAKDRVLQLMMKVLMSFKQSEIDNAITGLDQQCIDVLMKYIYRGFEFPSDGSSANLLIWFEKVYSVGGVGSVTRVLTDRKRV